MKNSSRIGIIILMAVLALSACAAPATQTVQATEPPSPTKAPTEAAQAPADVAVEPTATLEPTPTEATAAVITTNNILQVQQIGQFSMANAGKLSWSKDGSKIGLVTMDTVLLIDAQTLEILHSANVSAPDVLFDFSPESGYFAKTPDYANVQIINILDGSIAQTVTPGYQMTSVSFSPDGQKIATVSGETWQVDIWDVQTGAKLKTLTGFETAAPVYNATFSSNGEYLIYVARAKGQLQNIESGTFSGEFNHEDFIMSIALSPDSSQVAAATGGTVNGSYVPIIQVWDVAGDVVHSTLVSDQPITSLDYSPDGTLLAAASGNNIQIWNMETGNVIATLTGHNDGIVDVAFSPNGTALVSASYDGTLRLWKVQ